MIKKFINRLLGKPAKASAAPAVAKTSTRGSEEKKQTSR